MKKIFKLILLKLLSFNFLRVYFFKLIQFILRNFQEDSANWYELATIKRIGTKEGEFNSKKITSFLKNNTSLSGSNFLDIGCGDLFLYPNLKNENITKYFGFDLNNWNLNTGLNFLKKQNYDIQNLITEQGSYFDFKTVKKAEIDIAFSQAVCSHLTLNSLIVMLKNLKPKMKSEGVLLSSFIIISNDNENGLELKKKFWKKTNKFNNEPHEVTSFFLKDPYHYDLKTISKVANICGWELYDCKDYDHDLQKMLFFKLI